MKRLRPLLGTWVEIGVEDVEASRAASVIERGFAAVELVHRLMSVHRPDSDLSRINHDAWRAPVTVHPWTLKTLRWALLIRAATDGLFDCALGHELGRHGLVDGHAFEGAASGSLADVGIARDGAVRLTRRIALDFGGIAKGFAVDRAIAILRAAGARRASVNAGGDLRVMGDAPQAVHVRTPSDPRGLRLAGFLTNGAIATSATDGAIDVTTRQPIRDGRIWSVIAPRCIVADALTKVVAQTGRTEAPWLARFGATVWVPPPLLATA
ncbi:thiamine biosynthesis lipoprotein [Enhydrobacter aerosaccus]|uniref:FAD:protein FMN transferase n=2 Tax=Enhydrobacter aerosaccus TaxID=225324 RepID=A0A1T4SAI3_9HYPH|nr:thiamine biosynthesis lipoprotein [Enhydrobacter aerosaccus]